MTFMVHRQWTRHEQLRYPLASVVDMLIRQDSRKPGGTIFRRALAELACPADQACMAGDDPENHIAAAPAVAAPAAAVIPNAQKIADAVMRMAGREVVEVNIHDEGHFCILGCLGLSAIGRE